jgi:hypothetical protein
MTKKRLGEILLEEGFIDEEDLSEALKYKEKSGYRLGTALVALRMICEWQLTQALGKALDLPVIDLSASPPTSAALRRIPARLAERFDLVPLRLEGRGKHQVLIVAMSDPLNSAVIKRMEGVAGMHVHPVLAGLSTIQRAIRLHYYQSERSSVYDAAAKLNTSNRSHSRVSHRSNINSDDNTRQYPDHLAKLTSVPDGVGELQLPGLYQPDADASDSLHALNYKFRALLHLLLRKKLITEREYAETLKNLISTSVQRSNSE